MSSGLRQQSEVQPSSVTLSTLAVVDADPGFLVAYSVVEVVILGCIDGIKEGNFEGALEGTVDGVIDGSWFGTVKRRENQK